MKLRLIGDWIVCFEHQMSWKCHEDNLYEVKALDSERNVWVYYVSHHQLPQEVQDFIITHSVGKKYLGG